MNHYEPIHAAEVISASQFLIEQRGVSHFDVQKIIGGVHALTTTCHELSSVSGWWNRRMPNVPKHVRPSLEKLLNEAGYPIGAPMTPTEIEFTVPEKLCLTHSELSEAMEGHRKGRMDDHLPHRPALEVELADAVIRIADLAGALNLDLAGALIEKLGYNQQRADHKPEHRAAEGGKVY